MKLFILDRNKLDHLTVSKKKKEKRKEMSSDSFKMLFTKCKCLEIIYLVYK